LKLALSILVGTIVLGAICQSYIAVGISPRFRSNTGDSSQLTSDAKTEFPSDEPEEANRRETIEKSLWQNANLLACDKMLSEDWSFYAKEKTDEGRNRFRHTARTLANLRMDFAAYSQAADCYKVVLTQDNFFQKDSLTVASDYNNIGVCLGLAATITGDQKKKKLFFSEAIENMKEAERRLRELNNKKALFNCLVNQYTLLQDMHDNVAAAAVFAQMKPLNIGADASLRELLIEQN
jgi:hypothetical protein